MNVSSKCWPQGAAQINVSSKSWSQGVAVMNMSSKCWSQSTASGRVGGGEFCTSIFLIESQCMEQRRSCFTHC